MKAQWFSNHFGLLKIMYVCPLVLDYSQIKGKNF